MMNAFQTLEGLVHLERGSEPENQKQGRNQAEPKTDFSADAPTHGSIRTHFFPVKPPHRGKKPRYRPSGVVFVAKCLKIGYLPPCRLFSALAKEHMLNDHILTLGNHPMRHTRTFLNSLCCLFVALLIAVPNANAQETMMTFFPRRMTMPCSRRQGPKRPRNLV